MHKSKCTRVELEKMNTRKKEVVKHTLYSMHIMHTYLVYVKLLLCIIYT